MADMPARMQEQFGVPYSNVSSLNTLDVYIPWPGSEYDEDKIWIVYIHGGAWRDPAITSRSINPSLTPLLSNPLSPLIGGIASLNYRLSPYPSHPSSPSLPSDPARNALHPDHISDVLAGLAYLQRTYRFGSRYFLAGHSCGATLALQTCMGRFEVEGRQKMELPRAVVAMEGIYSLPSLISFHKDSPWGYVYKDFVTGAFGPDLVVWRDVSPALGLMAKGWDGVVVLAHSKGDELVEWEQVEEMKESLLEQGFSEGGNKREVLMLELVGKHDEVWEDGREVARAIGVALEKVVSAGFAVRV